MPPRPLPAVLLLLLLGTLLLSMLPQPVFCDDAHQYQQQQQQQQQQGTHQQQQELHDRMNELVDTVHGAVHDADAASAPAAGEHRQVVDVGQSLTLLETKFNNLRMALASELGVSKAKLGDHAQTSKQLLDHSTELVRSVIMQRDELSRLTTDIRDLDSTIRALRDNLHSFDADMASLSDVVDHLHQSHADLTESHHDVKHQLGRVRQNTKASVSSSKRSAPAARSQRWLVIILIIETLAAAAFLFSKRNSSRASFKAYGSKFG